MKVLMVNGSPHKEGCTYTALKEVAGAYVPVEIHSGDTISFADDEYTFYS